MIYFNGYVLGGGSIMLMPIVFALDMGFWAGVVTGVGLFVMSVHHT